MSQFDSAVVERRLRPIYGMLLVFDAVINAVVNAQSESLRSPELNAKMKTRNWVKITVSNFMHTFRLV